ncbi:MAG: hypothetical protein MOB07_19820 [Acidobacteria bacterium]|nr:hypothetical protein [Acidobacteriota bacterium]
MSEPTIPFTQACQELDAAMGPVVNHPDCPFELSNALISLAEKFEDIGLFAEFLAGLPVITISFDDDADDLEEALTAAD